jgi:hypothetical protein
VGSEDHLPLERNAIAAGLTGLLGLSGLEIEDRSPVTRALDWSRQGLDFANALHLASSGRAEAFATFDRALRRRAPAVRSTIRVVAP